MAGGLYELVGGLGSCVYAANESGESIWSAWCDRKLLSLDDDAAVTVFALATARCHHALHASATVANDDAGVSCWPQREAGRVILAVRQLEERRRC